MLVHTIVAILDDRLRCIKAARTLQWVEMQTNQKQQQPKGQLSLQEWHVTEISTKIIDHLFLITI